MDGWMDVWSNGLSHHRFNVNEMILIHQTFPLWNVISAVVGKKPATKHKI